MQQEIESIAQALASGRPIREHGPYEVFVGDEAFEFRPIRVDDATPTGHQILNAAELRPVTEYQVFQILRNGQLETLRLEETTDLRTKGVERFLLFRTDRTFSFDLDGEVYTWGAGRILGRVLKALAKVDPKTYGVWQEVRGKDDREIADNDFASLEGAGVERFFTGIKKTTEG